MPTETPFLSVITPVYKTGPLLLEAMDSLARQGETSFEWVLVNDGSTDAPTLDALKRIEAEAPFPARVFHIDNGGAARARNYGLGKARGEYVKFLDADDLQEPRLLEIQERLARANPGAIIAAPEKQIVANANGGFNVVTYHCFSNIPADIFGTTLEHPFLCHCTLLIPRPMVEAIDGYDESLKADQDGDFMLRLFWDNPGVVYNTEAAFLFRLHNQTERISGTNSPAKLASRYRVYEKVRQRLEASGRFEQYRNQLAGKLVSVAGNAVDIDPRLADEYVRAARTLNPDVRLHRRTWVHRLSRWLGFSRTRRLIRRIRR